MMCSAHGGAGQHLLSLQLLRFFLVLFVLVWLAMWGCGSLYVQMFASQVRLDDLPERHYRFFFHWLCSIHSQLNMHFLMSLPHLFADCCSCWWFFCSSCCWNGCYWYCYSLCHLLCMVGGRFTRRHEGY